MGNIGSGLGTSYPTSLDTQSIPEVDSPAAGKTLARAAVPNDLAAAVIAIETALGTSPQGSKANVKTFLQTEHGTNGTHQTQMTVASGSAASPQIKSATDATGFYFPVNQVGVSVAGSSVGLFTSTGLNGCAIGTTTRGAIAGTTGSFNGNFDVGTTKFTVAAASGNTYVDGTLGVNGAISCNAGLDMLGNIAINTNKFTVAAASGNTVVAGTADVTSNFRVNTNKFEVLAASGNTTIAGALGVTGATSLSTLSITEGAIISGTYTPTPSNLVNLTSATGRLSQYLRVGNVVFVSGAFDLDLSASNTVGDFTFDLPIASTFTDAANCVGSLGPFYNDSTNTFYSLTSSYIYIDVGSYSTVAQATFGTTTGGASACMRFSFSYRII